jgi:predicted P-loop ATPase
VGELQATTRRADREALKHFITTQEVTIRKAYGRNEIVKPAMCSLIGTINEDGAGFLTDPTGTRRFAVVNLAHIRHEYAQAADVTRLWSQAVHLYRQGEPWQPTPEEARQIALVNDSYENQSPLAILFLDQFTVDPTSSSWWAMTEILKVLDENGLKGTQQANMNDLARVLKRLGATAFRPKGGNGSRPRSYRGVIRLADDGRVFEPAPINL